MILTRSEIVRRVATGEITIDPFDIRRVNPNSYNYRLGDEIKVLPQMVLDPKIPIVVEKQVIPRDGLVLNPGRIYLGHTMEIIGSHAFVTSLIGRSSVGRLGLYVQVSADLGNLGAIHRWTLELVAVQPIRVYPEMIIGQVSFWVPKGVLTSYGGRYGTHSEPMEAGEFGFD